jgi:hypothetical protein
MREQLTIEVLGARDDFGGDLFKYNFWTDGYDPIAGKNRAPGARATPHAHLPRALDARFSHRWHSHRQRA